MIIICGETLEFPFDVKKYDGYDKKFNRQIKDAIILFFDIVLPTHKYHIWYLRIPYIHTKNKERQYILWKMIVEKRELEEHAIPPFIAGSSHY